MLLGRQVALNFDMAVSGLQETVTVTGEAPLLDTTTSTIGSNIDPRQMQDIPINGRNWMDLTLLVGRHRARTRRARCRRIGRATSRPTWTASR